MIGLQKKYLGNDRGKNWLKGNRIEVVKGKALEWEEEKKIPWGIYHQTMNKWIKKWNKQKQKPERERVENTNSLEAQVPKGEKSFKQKGVVDSVKHCKENNKDKSVRLTKYETIKKFCESIFVEL